MVPPAGAGPSRESFHRAQQRRKSILICLISVSVGTGLWSLINGGQALELNLVADAATAFYAALLLDSKRRRVERSLKVRTLQRPSTQESEFFEVIEASGGNSR